MQKIHLVQPDQFVADNFRFELTEALKKGEAVYWIKAVPEPLNNLVQRASQKQFNSVLLQASINAFLNKNTELHLYLLNDQRLAEAPFIRVPATYQLHTIVDSIRREPGKYIAVSEAKNVFIDPSNKLVNRPVVVSDKGLQPVPVHSGRIKAWVTFRDKAEQQTVLAALRAFSEVYALDLEIRTDGKPTQRVDWILTDGEIDKRFPQTLYVITQKLQVPTTGNVIYAGDKFSIQTTEMARTGQLPEWLGELFVRHFNLKSGSFPLSPEELKTVFITTAQPESKPSEPSRKGLLLAFVLVIGAERWMALKRNA
ncbi:BatA domain-containing protein [Larkinella ripae]